MVRELRSKWFLFIPVIAIIYTIWVILLALGRTLGYARAYEYFGFDQWLYLGSAIFILLIVIMIIWMAPPKREEEVISAVEEEKMPVTIEAEPLPAQEIQKIIISYPQEVEGAIYADTFIEINANTTLSVRTFVGRSCLLCPNRNECLEEYKEKISFKDFISSIDCFKASLKRVAG